MAPPNDWVITLCLKLLSRQFCHRAGARLRRHGCLCTNSLRSPITCKDRVALLHNWTGSTAAAYAVLLNDVPKPQMLKNENNHSSHWYMRGHFIWCIATKWDATDRIKMICFSKVSFCKNEFHIWVCTVISYFGSARHSPNTVNRSSIRLKILEIAYGLQSVVKRCLYIRNVIGCENITTTIFTWGNHFSCNIEKEGWRRVTLKNTTSCGELQWITVISFGCPHRERKKEMEFSAKTFNEGQFQRTARSNESDKIFVSREEETMGVQ